MHNLFWGKVFKLFNQKIQSALTYSTRHFFIGQQRLHVLHNDVGLPLAAVICLPLTDSGLEPTNKARFDKSTLAILDCGVTMLDLTELTNGLLPQLFVLTSRPEVLTEDDVTEVTGILARFLNNSQKEVI